MNIKEEDVSFDYAEHRQLRSGINLNKLNDPRYFLQTLEQKLSVIQTLEKGDVVSFELKYNGSDLFTYRHDAIVTSKFSVFLT